MFEDDRYVYEDGMQKLAKEDAKSQMKLEEGILLWCEMVPKQSDAREIK